MSDPTPASSAQSQPNTAPNVDVRQGSRIPFFKGGWFAKKFNTVIGAVNAWLNLKVVFADATANADGVPFPSADFKVTQQNAILTLKIPNPSATPLPEPEFFLHPYQVYVFPSDQRAVPDPTTDANKFRVHGGYIKLRALWALNNTSVQWGPPSPSGTEYFMTGTGIDSTDGGSTVESAGYPPEDSCTDIVLDPANLNYVFYLTYSEGTSSADTIPSNVLTVALVSGYSQGIHDRIIAYIDFEAGEWVISQYLRDNVFPYDYSAQRWTGIYDDTRIYFFGDIVLNGAGSRQYVQMDENNGWSGTEPSTNPVIFYPLSDIP